MVIVATEGDSVYALDAASGAARWRTNLGRPVPNSELPCGNIDPVGITGTPVVDPGSAGTLWVVAMVEPRRYVLVALAVRDGAEQHRVDVSVPGLDPRTHIQRGALTVLGGRVYVPFGGRFGDCGQYHGWVLGYPTSGTGAPAVYQVPTGREGGIWAPPGPTSAPDGTLLVATGNSDSTSRYDMGNSVVRLSADLRAVDSWAPRDWVSLNRTDTDIGSISPAVGPGGAVVQVGKSGVAYLLRGNRLGGIGGEVAKAQVCGRAFGGTAVSADAVYVSCDDGVVALRVTASSLTKLWSGPAVAAGPPAVSAGVVWSVDTGSGTLLGLDPGDGHVLSKIAIGRVTHFTGVAIGGGQLVVATTSTVSAWR